MMKNIFYAFMVLLLGACNQIPAEQYYNRGDPYSLLDSSSEVVNVSLISEDSITEIVQWIDQDQPTQAELYCLEGDTLCMQALETLESFHVPVTYIPAADNSLTLVYDRVVARDCDNRYMDNPINPYNLNHPTFGCSVAVNMVQMISDKRQLTSPALLDYMDGERAVQTYQLYRAPRDLVGENKLTDEQMIENN